MRFLFLVLLFLVSLDISAQSFAPENDQWIGVENYKKSTNTIQENEFDFVSKKVQQIYSPVFKDQGGEFVLVNNWKDGTVNAYTLRNGSSWEVHMFGGLARHPLMTLDGFSMVVCHEVGHQIGGLPKKYSYYGTSWAAAEGQSDYFSSKCMKELIKDENNVLKIKKLDIPNKIKEQCDEVYSDENESAICQRIAIAGEVLGNVLANLGNSSKVSLLTPSTLVVKKTNVAGYPSTQCQTDTYFQGALCNVDSSINPNDKDKHYGYCSEGKGSRPSCWYNEEN